MILVKKYYKNKCVAQYVCSYLEVLEDDLGSNRIYLGAEKGDLDFVVLFPHFDDTLSIHYLDLLETKYHCVENYQGLPSWEEV